MQEVFKNQIESEFSFMTNSRCILAISGGIDSVVLTYLLHDLNIDFALAHCNFNLRGQESDEDEHFVLDLAERFDREVFVQSFDTEDYAREHKCSIQMAARELRYNWFNELANQLKFDYIITAHHADDNLETFLINFLRGTGINGLTGIPTINDNILRPLLNFSRESIETYAKANAIKWREDSSNAQRKYLRNKLRQEVIPTLKEMNPNLLSSFKNTLENLNDTADIVEESLNAVAKRAIVEINEDFVSYKISEFKKVNNSKAYLFEMFKDYGFTEWNDVVDLLEAETGKYVVSNTLKLTKHREFLILSGIDEIKSEKTAVEINQEQTNIETPIGRIRITQVTDIDDNDKNVVFVEGLKLNYPLSLRLWQKGDFFYPLGMKGKKKVSKYLKDEKLTPIEKANTCVLTSGGQIVWVVGRRGAENYKVNESSHQIIKIELL